MIKDFLKKEERPGRHQRCPPIKDAVDDNMEKKMTRAQDFISSRNRPLHSRYD
jgi:hypothetical protein